MLQGDSSQQLPPDLPSFLFKERIVYLVRSFRVPGCAGRKASTLASEKRPARSSSPHARLRRACRWFRA